MTGKPSSKPIACTEQINKPVTSDESLAFALSIVKGRVFGSKAKEVEAVKLFLKMQGFEIVETRNRCGARVIRV